MALTDRNNLAANFMRPLRRLVVDDVFQMDDTMYVSEKGAPEDDVLRIGQAFCVEDMMDWLKEKSPKPSDTLGEKFFRVTTAKNKGGRIPKPDYFHPYGRYEITARECDADGEFIEGGLSVKAYQSGVRRAMFPLPLYRGHVVEGGPN